MGRLFRAASAFFGGRRSHGTGYHPGGTRRRGGIGSLLRRFLR